MKLRNVLKALFVFSILAIASQVHAGIASPPTVSETFDPGGLSGRYTVINPLNSGVEVFGFAIENNLATSTATSRGSWFADLVSAAAWDDYEIILDGTTLFTLGDFRAGDFEEIFGGDATQRHFTGTTRNTS